MTTDTVKTTYLSQGIDKSANKTKGEIQGSDQAPVKRQLRKQGVAPDKFKGKLKDLFVESYVDVPDSKVDLVDDLNEQVVELEDQLNTTTGKMIAMTEELELFQRYEVVREHASGLAETEVEKLASLVEDLDFEDTDSFSAKVKIIKENHFKKAIVETQVEEIEEEWNDNQNYMSKIFKDNIDPSVLAYLHLEEDDKLLLTN